MAEQLLVALAGPPLWRALDRGDDAETGSVTRQLIADEESLEQLARDHYVERAISRREFLAAREMLEERIARNRATLGATATGLALIGLPRTLGELQELWRSLDIERQRAIMEAVIEEITVNPGAPGRRIFDTNRIEIRWRA